MQQAIDRTTAIASPEDRAPRDRQTAGFTAASALVSRYFEQLGVTPYGVEVFEDFPAGCYQGHLKFRGDAFRGLLQFAELTDAPVTRADTAFGTHLDVYVRVEGILLRASTLLSPAEALLFEQDSQPSAAPAKQAALTAAATLAAVPLGASVTFAPGVSTTVDASATATEDDEARCVRCGCTENAACPGGCAWVPNTQLIDLCSSCATPEELAATAWTAVGTRAGER